MNQEALGEPVVEYGQLMSGGGVHVWSFTPQLLQLFPLEQMVQAGQLGGGVVVRRTVRVVTNWEEVPRVE